MIAALGESIYLFPSGIKQHLRESLWLERLTEAHDVELCGAVPFITGQDRDEINITQMQTLKSHFG